MKVALRDVEMRLPDRESPLFFLPSLELGAGSKTLIHGPSGRGKTTLLNLISGQFLPHSGKIRVGNEELTEMDAGARARLRRESMGLVFQRWNLVDHLTALENVVLGIFPARADREAHALESLRRTGLERLAHRRAGLLSPGEQQRVAVARLWASSPKLLLADEPTSSLDNPGVERVMGALWEASEERTLLVVSHDPRLRSMFREAFDFQDLVAP